MSDNPLLPKPRERVIELFPGDAEQRLRDAYAQLDQAIDDEKASEKRMAFEAPSKALARSIDEMQAEANAEVIRVHLREIPSRDLRALQDDCKPRDDNKRDEIAGLNVDEFYKRLIRAAIVEPVVTDEQFEDFADQVGEFNWQKLVNAIDAMSMREVDVPKSSAVSALERIHANEAKLQNDTE